MAEAQKVSYTREGLKELQDELAERQTVKAKEISARLEEARAQGDLSENSEYDEAKSEQGKLESRINELEAILQNYKLIDEDEFSADTVNRASKVTIKDMETKEEETYQIVGPQQANPMKGRISDESPVGKALLGKKKGATITVETPAGMLKYKIVNIEKM